MHKEQKMTRDEKMADFAKAQLARYTAYHTHKETMAYVGFGLFAGLIGAILVSENWPPNDWGCDRKLLALTVLTLTWIVALIYLRFQLRRRRWAALRMAACERTMANCVTETKFDASGFEKKDSTLSNVKCVEFIVDFVFWPLQSAVKPIKKTKVESTGNYPGMFVDALELAKTTDAIYHERLMHVTGWGLYVASMVRTL